MRSFLRLNSKLVVAAMSFLAMGIGIPSAHADFNVNQNVKIDVVAAGDSYQGAPSLGLKINGIPTGTPQNVTNARGTWKTYTFNVHLTSVFNTFSVTFNNDAYGGVGKDRNLYIQSVAVNGVVVKPATASVFGPTNDVLKTAAQAGNLWSYTELMWNTWPNTALINAVYNSQATTTTAPSTTTTTTTAPTTPTTTTTITTKPTTPTTTTTTTTAPIVPTTPTVPVIVSDKVLTDYQYYSSGPYQAYVSPWGKGALVLGKDYNETISLNMATFPNNVVFAASWPNTAPTSSGVYNFNSITYGNFCGAAPKQSVAAKRIKDITTLTRTHDFSLSGNLQGFDVIDDIMVSAIGTNACNVARSSMREIEIFYHSPPSAINYAKYVTKIGTVTISGISWDVSMDTGWSDVLFIPTNHQDVTSATIDMKAVFTYLISQKVKINGVTQQILTGEEYFNGFGFGNEVTLGSGSMKVNSFMVNLK
jgi:hypothetical protein